MIIVQFAVQVSRMWHRRCMMN